VPKIGADAYTAFEELFFYGGDRGQWLHDRMRAMQVTKVAEPFQAILDRAAVCEFSVTELRGRLSALDRFKFQMLDFYRDYDVIICPVATGPASSYEKALAAKEGFNLANDLTYNHRMAGRSGALRDVQGRAAAWRTGRCQVVAR
jgi:amidase